MAGPIRLLQQQQQQQQQQQKQQQRSSSSDGCDSTSTNVKDAQHGTHRLSMLPHTRFGKHMAATIYQNS
jgi:hypothetical protein